MQKAVVPVAITFCGMFTVTIIGVDYTVAIGLAIAALALNAV